VLDLTAVPEDLQMAELLGWRKGAFTGAVKDTPGALARAEGGTLFIDEIDKLSLKAQAGLLRVLEEHRYRPLGDGETERTANVRFLVGTNAKLAERVRGGTFREDLYFRINVLPVHVPPLVERRDEIPAWAAYMLAQRQEGDPVAAKLTADAESVLCAQPWPGNLRQLDNIVRRAYAIAKMDEAEPGVALPVHAGHIRRALVYEEGSGRRSLIEALHMAAAAFVEEAIRRKASGEEALELDMAGAFRGFVLGTAVAREGSKEAALRLLGTEVKIQQRNQSRQWRLEMEAVARLCELLGEEDDTPFGPLDGQRRTP
jgi:DNA-binding NtrC family response regulator